MQALLGQQQGQMQQGQEMPQIGAVPMMGGQMTQQMQMMPSGQLAQALIGGIGTLQPKYMDMFGQGRF